MKSLFAVLIAVVVGFFVGSTVVKSRVEARAKAERDSLTAKWEADRAALEAELQKERNKPPTFEPVRSEVANSSRRSADEILQNLLKLNPSGGARIATIRKIVHELEDLAELKQAALSPIDQFLQKNTDLDYSLPRSVNSEEGESRWRPPWSRSTPETEFTLPPSLRIGLFDVLKDIGGEGAERILADVLGTSGRAVELAYITRILEQMSPGKYREEAIAAAKDLLRNPLAIDSPTRLDEQSEAYLYGILELFGDNSFSNEAKNFLVDSEGRLNRNVQHYLARAEGEQVVATFYDLYKKNTVSNVWDKMAVANRILDHVGPNMQANTFLNEIVTNPELDTRTRSFAIMRLAGGFGGMDSPTDPKIIRDRMNVLEAIKPDVTEDRIKQTIDMTERNLQNLLDGKPVENPWSRDRRPERGPNDPPR